MLDRIKNCVLVLALSQAQVAHVLVTGLQAAVLLTFTGLVAPGGRAANPIHMRLPALNVFSSATSFIERNEASVAPAACDAQVARAALQLCMLANNLKQNLELDTVLHPVGHPEVVLDGQ